MTDAVVDGGAPAPAAPVSAPIDMEPASHTAALGSQTPVADKAEVESKPEPSKSARDAIMRAQETLKAKEAAAPKAEPKEQPKAEVKAEPRPAEAPKAPAPRSEDGKFAPTKPAEAPPAPVAQPKSVDPNSPHREAPARFSADAKAAWETAPEPVKAEVHRALRELEQGHQKYKADSERFDKVREYDDLARSNGREGVHESLKQVVEIERAFQRNPIEGFQKIADHFGISLRAVAAHIMGQTPDQVQGQQDSTIAGLKQQIARLEQQLGGVTQTIHQQRETETLTKVQAFAKDHPRFDELTSDIEFFLKSGRTNDLSEAYELAERLNPAPNRASMTEPVIPAVQPAPLNPAGQKSIHGAPSTGSDPDDRANAPVPSTREALRRAAARAG